MVPPYSGTLVAFSPLCGKGTGGEAHVPRHAGHLDGEPTEAKPKQILLSQTLICRRHQMMMNLPEIQSLLQQLLPSRKKKNW